MRWSRGPGAPTQAIPPAHKVERSPFWFNFLFLPDGFSVAKIPNAQDYDLILVDLPPFVESIRSVRPDLWVIPIKDAPSLINTGPALKNMRAQGGQISFVPNGFADGERELRKCLEALASIPNATVISTIGHRPTISRVATQSSPPWYVTNGVKNGVPRIGAQEMLRACETLIRMAGFRTFSAAGVVRKYFPAQGVR